MYRIYHTKGVVLQSHPAGEASKLFTLFTRELGVLYARAQSVRETHSKLRYSLQDYSLADFDLVRGKNGWRVTSAIGEENLAAFAGGRRKDALGVLARVAALLTRLFRGEEKDTLLFEDFVVSFRALKNETHSVRVVQDFEALLVMRILHRLGYWGEDAVLSPFLESSATAEPNALASRPVASLALLLGSFAPVRARAIRRINQALKETQL